MDRRHGYQHAPLRMIWWYWADKQLPMWVWRWGCWLRGHEDDSYGMCVWCCCMLEASDE